MTAYSDAIFRYPLTPEAMESAAVALAEALAGGKWHSHFTEAQCDLWRRRAAAAMQVVE